MVCGLLYDLNSNTFMLSQQLLATILYIGCSLQIVRGFFIEIQCRVKRIFHGDTMKQSESRRMDHRENVRMLGY